MKFSLYLALIFIGNVSFAQVAINSDNSAPHSSAQLEVKSANKGLLLPRVDPSAVANPTAGLFLYNNTNNQLSYHNGNSWSNVSTNGSLLDRFPNSMAFPGSIHSVNDGNTFDTYLWTIPAGVSSIWVELWAGGVGGAALNSSTTVADNNSGFVGGDAGDYASVIVDVTPGENIDVQTGKGGNAGPPGNTSIFVSLPSRSYAVGRQASMINYTVNGSTVTPVPGIVQFVAGGDGKRTEFTFAQSSATQYRKVYTGGDGGDAYPAQKGGKGLTFSFDMATGGILVGSLVSALGSVGSSPGAGGGIGFGNISSGGSGLVIIHW